MAFIKKNFHDILRLYIYQIGITIFAFMLYTASGIPEDEVLVSQLRTVVSVFSLLFYLVLLYYVAWEYGAKDKIRVDAGRIDNIPLKGMLMSLIANIPNFILSFISLVLSIIVVFGNEALGAAFLALMGLTMVHASMYMGISQTMAFGMNTAEADGDIKKWLVVAVLFVVLPLLSVGVTQLAYYLGSREIKILSIFSKKKK